MIRLGCLPSDITMSYLGLEICPTCAGAIEAIVKIRENQTPPLTRCQCEDVSTKVFHPETLLMEVLSRKPRNPGGCAAPLARKAQRVHPELWARSTRGVGAGQLIVRSIYSLGSFVHMCVSQCVKNHFAPPTPQPPTSCRLLVSAERMSPSERLMHFSCCFC